MSNSVAWIVKTSPLSNFKLLKDNPLKNKKRKNKNSLNKDPEETDTDIEFEGQDPKTGSDAEKVIEYENNDINTDKNQMSSEDLGSSTEDLGSSTEDLGSSTKKSFSYLFEKKYISLIPVEPEEIIEDKMIELMETFINRNGNPNKDKNFWIREGHLYSYDGWTWRTTKEGIVFKFYRKGSRQDIYAKPLFIGVLLEATTIYKTFQNFHKYEGNIVFAKDCFSKNKDFKKWIEKLGLLTN